MANETSIRNLITDRDFEAAVALLTETFGPRKNLSETFKKWLTDASVLAAFEKNTLVGLSIAQANPAKSPEALKNWGEQAVEFFKDRSYGTFLTLAVSPHFRKNGIGELLAARQMKWFAEKGCSAVLGTAWNHGSSDHSSHLFTKGGFTQLGELKDFYREGSEKDGHLCPVCHGVCRCSASLYGLHLKNN